MLIARYQPHMKNFLLILGLLSLTLFSCRRELPLASSGVKLQFSKDTVYFDTALTTVASSTYNLKVYNPSEETVNIDQVSLARGEASYYRLNVNGIPGKSVKNVEILPHDSIHIFIEITPEINGFNQSYLYKDSVLFANKGVMQHVKVLARTQDVYFHYPTNYIDLGNGILPYSIIDCNTDWINDKPHVIYGYAVVDSGCVLNIKSGAEVRFHQNSGLWVFSGGSLRVGEDATSFSAGDSVLFASDRLESFYDNAPGQWGGVLGGIFIQGGSSNNLLRNAVIKNATTALRVDSNLNPNLEIQNSYILNSSRTGLLGGYANMKAENLVIANAGVHLFYAFGGSYEFKQCTFANYWSGATRNTAAVALANYLDTYDRDGNPIRIVRDLNQAAIINCIISGRNRDELTILEDTEGELNYHFDHLLLKHDKDNDDATFDVNDPTHFNQVLVNADPDFVNPEENNYQLDSLSQAVDQGSTLITGPNSDIRGNPRNFNSVPDLGAYERQY